ncbi:serine/threonine-protein kinase ATM [Carex littledalei]|uniref:Serine/threonine-protein kinase ATM n=1 Tax=Carex littledalei TaxID=544730 RepID=A0A833QM57_9POAL|nr:serine/threonine-protein kinase ATM [Carex littledalei]
MATPRDVREVVSKLSSDKPKFRDEGVKLLSSWLEGERSYGFSRLLAQNTLKIKPGDIPPAETWPYIITLLTKCVALEISSSKKRPPKILHAKTLRMAVQCAEDPKLLGQRLFLFSIVKSLFNHILEVTKDVSSFHSEYSSILRSILIVRDYRYQMRNKIYSSLVLLFLNKAVSGIDMKSNIQSISKEDLFRSILTLHVLLENPPGDFTDSIRNEIISGFCNIFVQVREEGKILRKLMECVNTYLTKDGPNLGFRAMEIHSSLKECMFRSWLTTHDRSIKNSFITYGRLMLRLNRGVSGGGGLVEQFFDVIIKELDQSVGTASGTSHWAEMFRDEKTGSIPSIHEGLMDLAANVLYQACKYTVKASSKEKRLKMEHPATIIHDGILKGSFLWSGATCHLIHYYGSRIEKSLLIDWFDASYGSLKRILDNADSLQIQDTLLWLLRALQELSFVLWRSQNFSLIPSEIAHIRSCWQDVWNSLMQSLPIIFSTTNSADQVGLAFVTQDVWDLRTFKHMPSLSALHFISCVFSRIGFQGGISGSLFARKNLLEATLELANLKEPMLLNDGNVTLIADVIFSLCTGSSTSLSSFTSSALLEQGQGVGGDYEFSVEALAELNPVISQKVEADKNIQTHLPMLIKEPLVVELMKYLEVSLASNPDFKKINSSALVYSCSLLCNIIYCALVIRLPNETSHIMTIISDYISQVLNHLASEINYKATEIQSKGFVNASTLDSCGPYLTSLKSLVSSPLFNLLKKNSGTDLEHFDGVNQSLDALLMAFAKLFEAISESTPDSGLDFQNVPPTSLNSDEVVPFSEPSTVILDMELDANSGSGDIDASKTSNLVVACSPLTYQMELVSIITTFFSILPTRAWEILYNCIGDEPNDKVHHSILHSLCKHIHDPTQNLSVLVKIIDKTLEESANKKLLCLECINAMDVLLERLLSPQSEREGKIKQLSTEHLSNLSEILNKIAETEIPDWSYRGKLIGCIFSFISLDPDSGQAMIERLLAMLHDPDYRVRLIMARKIGFLFQMWDGHNELFHDISSNFGVQMVRFSNEKIIKAKEVIVAGSQLQTYIETALITLGHLALFSEDVEVECVFMMCAAASIEPIQRDLTYTLVDNVSKQLSYPSRRKVQNLFGFEGSNPKVFIEFCNPFILPFLVLKGDATSLNWISKVSCLSLSGLINEYFVPIFAVSMVLNCSTKPEKEYARRALCETLLQYGDISETQRDDLIKKHLVSIVGFLLFLTSSSPNPKMPYFAKETIARSVKTIVDGFLEMDDNISSVHVVDKINIFRPDRVFKFLVEMHYQITASNHFRHVHCKLSAIEALMDVLGHRVIVPSTSYYIISIIGNFIQIGPLQDQCCIILSKLTEAFNADPTKETISVLGGQLQFLVSRLVASCISFGGCEEGGISHSSSVVSLLHQLTVDASPSLYDYTRELEPFPTLKCLEKIRVFHNELSRTYSPRDQFLKFVKRAPYLPPKLFFLSLEMHHSNLVSGLLIDRGSTNGSVDSGCWYTDLDFVSAAWALVDHCSTTNEYSSDTCALAADFLSRVGICDPHHVVLLLPENTLRKYTDSFSDEASSHTNSGVSEELLIQIVRLLKICLSDDSVKIVDIAAQTLKGILSTAKGQNILQCLDSHDKSLLAVHSKGVNMALVEKLLLESDGGSTVLVKESSLWETEGKTYETWVCSLVYSLIAHCDDIILRLCQSVVLLKAEIAEQLLASVLVSLAKKADSLSLLCEIISKKIKENIFVESNNSLKSIQVFLEALNKVRSFYIAEKVRSVPSTPKASSSLRLQRASVRSKDKSPKLEQFTSSWQKVYWLSIDYLEVAKAAMRCGSYFTAVLYAELWCEEHFTTLSLGSPDFSHEELLPHHIDVLVAAYKQINEPDSIYGIVQTNKMASQIVRFEHEGNWSKSLEYYDLLVRSAPARNIGRSYEMMCKDRNSYSASSGINQPNWDLYKGLVRSLQKTGCTHMLDTYCQGLTSQKDFLQNDPEFVDIQFEAAWRAGNWDFSFFTKNSKYNLFNESLHNCLRALQEGDNCEFLMKLKAAKKDLVRSLANASKESTKYIHSTVCRLQMLDHISMSWDVRWKTCADKRSKRTPKIIDNSSEAIIPGRAQMEPLNEEWRFVLQQTQLDLDVLEPFIAFRRVLLQILDCKEFVIENLLQSASVLRKGSKFSLAAAALHELKGLCCQKVQGPSSQNYYLARLEEAKLLRAEGQHDMAVSLGSSRTIIEQYLKQSVELTESRKNMGKCISRQCQAYFHLAHYTDALFKNYEERLASSEWQAALRLRKHKTKELDALIRRLRSSSRGEKTDYSVKIQELQKQLAMDKEEEQKLQDDRDNFLRLALDGYQRSLVVSGKYDLRVVFRLVSLWFNLSSCKHVVESMQKTVKEVHSYKFIPLVYQIASRLGSLKDAQGSNNFQNILVSLLRKMAIDHPYHTMFQLLALANGDRVKDRQRSRSSFVVDIEKKQAAENLLNELGSFHGPLIRQMKMMVEAYIKLAELETNKEDTNKKVPLPREIRSLRQLELVPVVTATIPVNPSCQYGEGSFPHFKGFGDSIMIMNGINAPKQVECLGSDGEKYRQLAKSGNDDLRQDAVMEQFFGLVNMFLQNHRDTWKRRLGIRTYKVVPFTPSAGLVEWVNGTIPIGEYLLGSTRSGGAHARYGVGNWSFLQCREHMSTEKDKKKAFLRVCDNFRPVMHHFFLERFSQPVDWFGTRLSYTRSVAASSMVGYVVGLGDRHSMNILIDQKTAEVIHIDLGVAFEQGLMLKTPERVPFRLTRDMIDGMGVTGVEGVFRRCCEETLSVMRTNKEALLTIIEVFIHDPLYKWALSPLKALQRQKETEEEMDSCLDDSQDAYEGNKDAARASLRVKQKLDGYEDGEMRSIQGQVQQLIQDAVDIDRLCQMFPGWGAWL